MFDEIRTIKCFLQTVLPAFSPDFTHPVLKIPSPQKGNAIRTVIIMFLSPFMVGTTQAGAQKNCHHYRKKGIVFPTGRFPSSQPIQQNHKQLITFSPSNYSIWTTDIHLAPICFLSSFVISDRLRCYLIILVFILIRLLPPIPTSIAALWTIDTARKRWSICWCKVCFSIHAAH